MKTKSFKIGEYAIGGIIKVTIKPEVIHIQALDYNTEKLVIESCIPSNTLDSESMAINYLHTLTSSYYTEKVMEFIRKNVKFQSW